MDDKTNIWSLLQKLQRPELFESDFAILILNQPILCDPELIKTLWNKAILRVLVDGGTNRWLEFLQRSETSDLKLPDFLSGDFDSILPESRAYFEGQKVKIIPTPDQDETDFTKALRCMADILEASNLKINMVLTVCENSGRFDQAIGNINTLHLSDRILQNIPVALFSSQTFTWVLRPGKHIIHVAEDFVKDQYSCGLIPFCGPTLVSTSGLKWNLENHILEIGGLISTSNTFISNQISASCNRNLVWTAHLSTPSVLSGGVGMNKMITAPLIKQYQPSSSIISDADIELPRALRPLLMKLTVQNYDRTGDVTRWIKTIF